MRNRDVEELKRAINKWNDQVDYLFSKTFDRKTFREKVRLTFNIYLSYSIFNDNWCDVTELNLRSLMKYSYEMKRNTLYSIINNGYKAQHLYREKRRYKLTPVGRRANAKIKRALIKLDKEKHEFGYKTLFDVI